MHIKKDNFDGPRTAHQNRYRLPDGGGIHQSVQRKSSQEAASDDPALHGQRFVDVISNIQKYFQELPRFEHIMNTLVTQPIIGDAVSSQLTFIIKLSGTVIYQDNSTKPFQKTFTVTAQGDKWKIASNCSAASGCWMLSI
ncbi:NTF2-related export protein [Aedes aegypti]|uniref:Uncharacterized protein n=1 Tax=Aedes aegypti TaxID=7159 RepID=A0A6I8TAM7_AEDAE|nr:NTF2-related export protein [Aedes aegypti]